MKLMKHISIHKTRLFFAVCCSLAILTTGCVKESLDECPPGEVCKIVLKVVNAQGDEITEAGNVTEAAIYLFDENGDYLETYNLSQSQIETHTQITLNYPAGKKVQAVAWGNVNEGEAQAISEAQIIENLSVNIKQQNGITAFPDNIFNGTEEFKIIDTPTNPIEITIWPRIGTVKMYTENLPETYKQVFRSGEETCLMSVESLNALNYKGELSGENSTYQSGTDWEIIKDQQEWATEELNMVADDSFKLKALIDISDGTSDQIEEDLNGDPIRIYPEQRTEVVFMWDPETEAYLGVKVIVRPWGYVDEDFDL